ncbi:MAG: hypothetical protein DWQ35_10730 [Planctomycetota bacterium]|nr:MAG: hypothetical protein DWQ35_10730 [Planctomycetota bacterium]
MHRLRFSTVVAFPLVMLVLVISAPLSAAEVPPDLTEAYADMEAWLGRYPQGPGWHRYLHTEQLRAEMAKGEAADREQVAAILAKFRSGAKGLDDHHFVNVAKALARWHDEHLLPPADELVELARADSETFIEMDADDVATAKQTLASATDTLGSWLDRYGDNGARWKRFLNFSDLEAQLAASEPDLAVLEGVARQFTSDTNGLEMPKYLAVRDALRVYLDTHQVAHNPTIKQQVQQQTKVLTRLLEKPTGELTVREREAIGQRLAFFERMGQSPTLVRAVRRHHSHVNFAGYVTEDVVAAAGYRDVDRSQEGIRDSVLGTSLIIDAKTKAEVTADVVPNEERAAFQLLLTGVVRTDAVGFNRGVTIYSTGRSTISGRKMFFLDENGLSTEPATARARTNNHIDGISAKRRFVERIAWRKASKQKCAADRIGARKTARRVRADMDDEATDRLADAKRKYEDGFRDPLVRRAAFPEVMKFRSTDEVLQLELLQASRKQLGAPQTMPALEVSNDIGMRMHQSLINNLAASLYAERTLTSEEVEKESENSPLMRRFKEKQRAKREAAGEADDELDKPWAITFAKRPITVEFFDGQVKLTIRGTRFEGDGPVNERDMSIWVVYKFELGDNQGLKLALQEWDVVPTEVETGGRIEFADEPLRQKLKKRFAEIFKDVELDPLELPGEFKKAGQFAYSQVQAEEGWFSLGLDRIPGTGAIKDRVAKAKTVSLVADDSPSAAIVETGEATAGPSASRR